MPDAVVTTPDAGAAPSADATPDVDLDTSAEPATEDVAADTDGAEPVEAKPAKPQPRKFKVGEDEVDEAEVLREYTRRRDHLRAANKRFEEASATEKRAQALQAQLDAKLAALDKDPFALHRERGMSQEDINRLAYSQLEKELQMRDLKEKDPELYSRMQRREQLEKETEQLESKRQEYLDKQENIEADTKRSQLAAELERQIIPALDRAQLPRHPAAAYLAEVFAMAASANGAPVDYEEAAVNVKNILKDAAKSYLGNLQPEALEKEFPDLAKKLRQASVSRVAKAPSAPPSDRPVTPRKPQKANDGLDPNDFFNRLKYPRGV